jgi:NADPH-dependent curcumin reductase CurA
MVIHVMAFSADPYLRGSIKSTGYNKPGNPMIGFVAGKVIASKNPDWVAGDLIGASLPFSTLQVVKKENLAKTMSWKLTGLIEESDIGLGIGILGMPGSTAYGGLIDVLRPNKGDTIFISAASGAVGSLVGMIAKNIYDCKVIGSAGGPEKCALIKEKFGFDHAIDYKKCNSADELNAALKEVAPDGIDMYFENVGGMHFEVAFNSLKTGGRMAICGQISEYNNKTPNLCQLNPMKMIYSSQRIEGFVCHAWLTGKKGNFLKDMHAWLQQGKIVRQETVFEGIENWVQAF